MLGFLQICAGVVLLQLSKSSKDVPDAAVFNGDLDQVRTVAEQEEPESEPKADAIRGTAAIIRRISMSRQKMEAEEARRIHEDRLRDQMEPIAENERVEWDGLRRRKTVLDGPVQPLQRRKTLHPPLGMAHFPDDDDEVHDPHGDDEEQQKFDGGFMNSLRRRAQSSLLPGQKKNPGVGTPDTRSLYPVPLTEITIPPYKGTGHSSHVPQADGAAETAHVYGLPPGLESPRGTSQDTARRLAPPSHHQSQGTLAPTPPPHSAKRQFSFQNVFHRRKSDVRPNSSETVRPASRSGMGSRPGTKGISNKSATEEERLGLVKGDSTLSLPPPEYEDGEWHDDTQRKSVLSNYEPRAMSPPPIDEEEENEEYEKPSAQRGNPAQPHPELRNLMPISRSPDEDDHDYQLPPKDWQGHAGGGGPAFI